MSTMPRDERLEARPSERKGDGAPPVVQRHAAGAQLLGAAVAFIPVSGSRSVAEGDRGYGEYFYTPSLTADEPSFAALSLRARKG